MTNISSAIRVFLTVILISNSFCTIYAQKPIEINIRIHYIAKFFSYQEQKQQDSDETILDIGGKTSHFYSFNSVRREEIKDSILARGGSMGDVTNAWELVGYPRTRFNYQVWKNYPSLNTLTFTDKLLKDFRYAEPMVKPQWTLTSKDSIVAGYNCQQAETYYFGRQWKVWFTLDIPISDGPWKLHGLPGLILYAEDSDRIFSFTCIQIQNVSNKSFIFPDKKYLDCTKKEYHSLMLLHWKDPEGFAERMTGFRAKGYDAKGKPIVYPERTTLLLEKQ